MIIFGIITSHDTTDLLHRPLLIRLRLADVLADRGWTPYRLARETGLTVPTAYRLANTSIRFGRFTAETLDRLCAALGVQPGDLLEWIPDSAAGKETRHTAAAGAKPVRKPTQNSTGRGKSR